MAYESWEKVFDAASARVAATGSENRVKRTPIAISPHMLRHSFALHMLVALHHALDRRSASRPRSASTCGRSTRPVGAVATC